MARPASRSRTSEELVAIVELRDVGVDSDALGEHLSAHLADFKCPRTIRVVNELHRERNGKVLKRRLRAEHSDGS